MDDKERGGHDRRWQDRFTSRAFIAKIERVVRWTIQGTPDGFDHRADAVEDARQECLRHLWETAPPADVRDYDAWACEVARNKTRDWLRVQRRQTRNRQPPPLPMGDDDGDDYEYGEEYYRPSVDRDPVAQTYDDRETLNDLLEDIVDYGARHSRVSVTVLKAVLRGMLIGLPDAILARQLHLTEHQLRNLKHRVISHVLAERFQELLEQHKRRGPRRGKKGQNGSRRKPPRGNDEDSSGDTLTEAATRVAASIAHD